MADRTFLGQVILNEISGMKEALHGYDRIILTVRSGFLTIFFGGWAILLSGVAQKDAPLMEVPTLVVALLIFSVGLSIGGLFIDCNYVIRKFRVIHDLNLLSGHVLENPKIDEAKDINLEFLKGVVRISGISGKCEKGWKAALMVGVVIYLVPLMILCVVTWMLKLWSIGSEAADKACAFLA